MRFITYKDFQTVMDRNISNGKYFGVLHYGQGNDIVRNKSLIVDKKRISIVNVQSVGKDFINDNDRKERLFSGVQPSKFRVFLRMVKYSIYSNWMNERCVKDLVENVKYKKKRNNEKWDLMDEGEEFVLIDIYSCYWQMAHKLGYIDDDLFNRFLDNYSFKQSKRLCFTLLRKPFIIAEYYNDGSKINEIVCENNVLDDILFNIRNMSSIFINKIVSELGEDYLFYNIDGIAVKYDKYKMVSDFFKNENIRVSVNYCIKTVGNNYEINNQNKKI